MARRVVQAVLDTSTGAIKFEYPEGGSDVSRGSIVAPASSDNATALQGILNELASNGGGELALGPGVWPGPLTIGSTVSIRGAGESTIIRLPDSTTAAAVVKSSTYLANVDSETDPETWDHSFSLSDLAIDGNVENGGVSMGLAVWGAAYSINNVAIRHCSQVGFHSQYLEAGDGSGQGADPDDGPIAFIDGLRVSDCAEGAINFDGPHDSMFSNVETYIHNLEEDTDWGVLIGPRGTGSVFTGAHFWGNVYPTQLIVEADGVCFMNCFVEGGRDQIVHFKGHKFQFIGGRVFSGSNNVDAKGVVIGVPAAEAPVRYTLMTTIEKLEGGAVCWDRDGGKGLVDVLVPTENEGIGWTGTPAATTVRRITVHDEPSGNPSTWMPLREGGEWGMFGSTPVPQATDVPATAADIHAALVDYGIITGDGEPTPTVVNSVDGLTGDVETDTSVTIPAGAMGATAGAPTLSAFVTYWSGWYFDQSLNEETASSFVVPGDWSTMNVDFYWANAGAGTGDVRWVVGTQMLDDGDTAGTWTLGGANFTAGAQNAVVITRVVSGMTATGGSLSAVRFNRGAANAGDTLTNDAVLLAARFSKAS